MSMLTQPASGPTAAEAISSRFWKKNSRSLTRNLLCGTASSYVVRLTAVDHDLRACQGGDPGAGKQKGHLGNLRRLHQALHRYRREALALDHLEWNPTGISGLLREGDVALGAYPAGGDGVDPDPFAGEVTGKALGEGADGGVGGADGGGLGVGLPPPNADDVDDRAAATLGHLRHRRPGETDPGQQLEAPGAQELLVGQGQEIADGGTADVVDEDVDATPTRCHLDQGVDALRRGEVGADPPAHLSPAVEGAYRLVERSLVSRPDHHPGALRNEAFGDGAADAAATAADHRQPARE